MKAAYFDCFSGISGDMVLGALVDAGVELARLEAELRRLPFSGWKISAEKVRRGAISATKVNVETVERHHHRSLTTILKMIDEAGLAPRIAERARAIFGRLGQAEAKVHDVPIDKVHFHEVGAVDAIIDITGVPAVDTQVAQHLLKTVVAARLMGAECIVSGIRPQIAQTIVALGIEFGDIATKATLADALVAALRQSGTDVVRRPARG